MPALPINGSGPSSSAWTPTPRAHKGGLPDSHGWVPTPAAQTGRYRGQIGGGGAHAREKVEAMSLTWSHASEAGKTAPLESLASSVGLSGRQTLAAIYEHMLGFPPGHLSGPEKPTETPSLP
ncbi:MAG TPA: hypothetical protein VJP88_08585 [Caulobacteraceae bacterium]|nr:hypothetical protein [Caulobacteraceae bacterium]